MEEIEFSAKFAKKMKFHKNRGSFELKLNIWDDINSIRGIKFWNLDFKIWFSPSLVILTPSQTDETEIG